jgi:hypothetical protein
LCARRKIVTRLPCNRDNAFLLIVSILSMAATRSIKIPAVILDEFDYVTNLHRFDPDNCGFPGQSRDAKTPALAAASCALILWICGAEAQTRTRRTAPKAVEIRSLPTLTHVLPPI